MGWKMDPDLSNWTSAGGPEPDRVTALISAHDRDLRRVAVAITGDAGRADRAVLATWDWAQRRPARLGVGSDARARLLRRVAREARRRAQPPLLLRLRGGLPLVRPAPPATDPGANPGVAAALEPLTVEDRQMLALRHGVGLTTDEIAALLDLTGAGVRTHLAELRARLCDALVVPRTDEHGTPLTDREVEQQLSARLTPYLDRRPEAAEAVPTPRPARGPQTVGPSRTPKSFPASRLGRRPVIATTVVILVVAAFAAALSLVPGPETATGSPAPEPGTPVSVNGWHEHAVRTFDGTARVIGWAPDGAHVAVASAEGVTVFDAAGRQTRFVPGVNATWLDPAHLMVLTSLNLYPEGVSNLVLRSLDGGGDILVPTGALGSATTLVAGANGALAILHDPMGTVLSAVSSSDPARFAILRGGGLSPPISGIPLAWTPDGSRLAYLADPYPVYGGYRGALQLLDAATLATRNLGVSVVQSANASIGPSGRYLLGCVPATSPDTRCVLGLVDLADSSVEASPIMGQAALAAWAADGSVLVQDGTTVSRWTPGDSPVALRWQPGKASPVLAMAAAGSRIAVGLLKGPASGRRIAGVSPSIIVVSGQGVRSVAATTDGAALAYVLTRTGISTLVVASLAEQPGDPVASASATPLPSAAPQVTGTPLLAIPDTYVADQLSSNVDAVWGPRVYMHDGGYEQTDENGITTVIPLQLRMINLADGTASGFASPLLGDEQLAAIQTDGTNLVVEAYRRLGPRGDATTPCPSDIGQPIAWRLLAAALDDTGAPSGGFVVLDAGTASRVVNPPSGLGITCADVPIPPVSVANGLVAYPVEAPTRANPWASHVIVRQLSDGAAAQIIDTPRGVPWVGLGDGRLVWSEQADGTVSATGPFVVEQVAPIGTIARRVELPGGDAVPRDPYFLIAGSALEYTTYDPAGEGTASVWRLELDGGNVERISPQSSGSCYMDAATAAVTFMRCLNTTVRLELTWQPGAGIIVLDAIAEPVSIMVGGGWAVVIDWTNARLLGLPLSRVTG